MAMISKLSDTCVCKSIDRANNMKAELDKAEDEIARIVHRVLVNCDLVNLQLEVKLQDLHDCPKELQEEIYGDLIINPVRGIKLGVSVSIYVRPFLTEI